MKTEPELTSALMDCGGKRSATPLSYARLTEKAPSRCACRRSPKGALGHVLFSFALATLPLLGGCDRGIVPASTPKTEAPVEVKTTHPFRGEIFRHVTLPGEIK